jgi:hypothetical protein
MPFKTVNVKPMSMCTIHSLDKTIIIGAGVDQMFNDTLVGKRKKEEEIRRKMSFM